MRVVNPIWDYIKGTLLTTRGDIIRRGAAIAERLALGAAGTSLVSNGTDPAWANVFAFLTTHGDIIYRDATGHVRLAAGAAGEVLKTFGAAGPPYWEDIHTVLTTQGDVYYRDGTKAARLPAGTAGQALKTGGPAANPAWGDIFSLLTTKGDIIAHDGTAANRIPSSTLGYILQALGAGEVPEWTRYHIKHGGLHIKNFDYVGPGAFELRGVGFEPSVIIFLANYSTPSSLTFSVGLALNNSPIDNKSMTFAHAEPYCGLMNYCFQVRVDDTNFIRGVVTDFVADGFDMTVTETGASTITGAAFCIG